jgi:hypothetical protein
MEDTVTADAILTHELEKPARAIADAVVDVAEASRALYDLITLSRQMHG